jgi:very-short-patch-repair endonuclease
VPDDAWEGYEPDPEEIEAMRDAELAFREAHDLLDDRAWSDYVDEVGQEWLASQESEDAPPLPMPAPPSIPFIPPPGGETYAAESPVPSVMRGQHELTPIEAPFYDALAETGLTFSTQTWFQHADRRLRVDFIVWYDGRGVVVELDGHDYHKTKEQRRKDAERDRWLGARGIRVVRFTGSEVHADPERCVRELLDVVRQSQARP